MEEQPPIRNAEPDDAEAVRSVSRASWHAAYDDVLGADTVDAVVDEWYEVDGLRTAIDETIFHVADRDGDLVGFANAGRNPEYGADAFELFRIYVQPDDWNRGIGGRLLESVRADVRREGGDRLRLSVLAENEVGVRFYESHGFERLASEAIELDGETYVEYAYVKRLR